MAIKDFAELTEWDKYRMDKAKVYLNAVRRARNQIEAAKTELIAIRSDVSVVGSADLDGMPHNPNPSDDAVLNAVIALDSRSEKLTEIIKEFNRTVTDAYDILASLTCHECATSVLLYHYIQEKTWYATANLVNYSMSYIKSFIVPAALIELYDKMPHIYRDQIPQAC